MSRRKKVVSLVVAGGALLCVAAASLNYILAPAVVDQGGGLANSSNYELRGSIGGLAIATGAAATGQAVSPNYVLEVNSVALIDSGVAPAPGGGDGGGCTPSGPGAPRAAGAALGLLPALWMILASRRRRPRS
jgi:hypothetical protein